MINKPNSKPHNVVRFDGGKLLISLNQGQLWLFRCVENFSKVLFFS